MKIVSKVKKSSMMGIVIFICAMLATITGIINNTTVYFVVKDILKYGLIFLVLLVILGAIAIMISKSILNGPGNGLVLVGIVGTIMIVGTVIVAICAGIFLLFILVDTGFTEFGLISRSNYVSSDLENMIDNPWLYRLFFSGSVSVAVVMLFNMIKIFK